MTFLTPGFILLAIIAIGGYLAAAPAIKRVNAAREKLTADDLKTFGERYSNRANRHDMPAKFNDFAEASDKVSRIWLVGVCLVVAALAAYIFLGPNLGLPIGDAP